MGEYWNTKNIHNLLDTTSYICGKCGTTYNLSKGYQYSYFGNGISTDHTETQKGQLFYVFYDGYGQPTKGLLPSDYFENDVIAWKCSNCLQTNLSDAFTGLPFPFIPSSKDDLISKGDILIDDETLNDLVEEFYKAKELKMYSSAALLIRKIFMHVCVIMKWGNPGESFGSYVDEIGKSGYVSPRWKPLVEKAKNLGNISAHDLASIVPEDIEDAEKVLNNLLMNIYGTVNNETNVTKRLKEKED